MPTTAHPVITPEQLRVHWQGHRALTRRLIEAFPADQINTFSVGGLRSFGALVQELLAMPVPTLVGLSENKWVIEFAKDPQPKDALLADWDRQTAQIEEWLPKVPAESWQKVMNAFGYFEGPGINILLYVIDNEIHHRGQAYVYLRALGIAPPAFHER